MPLRGNTSARCVALLATALPKEFWSISQLILHGFGSNLEFYNAYDEYLLGYPNLTDLDRSKPPWESDLPDLGGY